MNNYYLCVDLKSFYASCECVMRNLDPLKTNLVVADQSRGNGTICLAVSPSLKKRGIANRCRVYDIPKDINYIMATPRMKDYIRISCDIYSIYLKYFSKDDILVYSIDECFIDITSYLDLYKKTPYELAQLIIERIRLETGLYATAGIGTNLFLAKVALDILAKKSKDYIGYLDIEVFKKKIWHHKPITDIWNIGYGISKRLAKYKAYDLYDVSQMDEKILYKEFGVNAEFLIDHSKGIEPCTMEEIHNYKSKSHSLSNSQVLFEDYSYKDALTIVKEMVDLNVLDLVDKGMVTNNIYLGVGYSNDSIKPTGGSIKLNIYTNSYKKLLPLFLDLFDKTTDKKALIRRISIGFGNVLSEDFATIDLFTNYDELIEEKNIQETIIELKTKFGKNAVFKGLDLTSKATTIERNKMVGGHHG